MKKLQGVLCLLCMFVCMSHSFAQDHAVETVADETVVGKLYIPVKVSQNTAVVVLGGSSGRLNAVYPEILADRGFVVLSLAYFRAESLPETLDQVPVETVSKALDYLSQQSSLNITKFGILGVSRGSEMALLSAATEPRLKKVAVIVPSSVAWQGQTTAHAWSYQGKPLPALSFERQSNEPVFKRAHRALQDTANLQKAAIQVEKINGDLLLISAEQDHIWPSTAMAEMMEHRLAAYSFEHQVTHLKLQDNHFLDTETVEKITPELIQHFE